LYAGNTPSKSSKLHTTITYLILAKCIDQCLEYEAKIWNKFLASFFLKCRKR